MGKTFYFLCCLLLLTGVRFSNAQELRHFRTISIAEGLSQSTVYAIVQDTLGFMWMGTQDGLNRYDGRNFVTYRSVKNDPGSLQSYYIRCLFVDSRGRVWVGGNKGVSCYNYDGNNFRNYRLAPGPGEWYISSIIEDAQHGIWAASNGGEIYRIDPAAAGMQTPYVNARPAGIREIYSIAFLGDHLLLGTESGLRLLDLNTRNISVLHAGIGNTRINNIYADGGWFWIGTEGKGLVKLNARDTSVTSYRYQPGAASLADDDVRSVEKDAQGNLWVGTFRGLSIMDRTTGRFQNYYHQASLPHTISQNSVRCIYRDRQKGMWLGTFYGGVSYYHGNEISFNLLGQHTGDASLNDKVVNVIRQDDKGNFWIGTNDRGLDYWIPSENKVKYYTHREGGNPGLSSNNIKAIAFGNGGEVFLGTHNTGLNILYPATGRISEFRFEPGNPSSIPGDMVYALLKDHAGRIWVGTRSGLGLFDHHNTAFTRVTADRHGKRLSSGEITYLMQDSRRRIWIGTVNGVNILYPDNMTFEPVERATLSSDVVNYIAEDGKQRIWIGTRDGLNLFDERSRSFLNYNNRKDLISGNINSILDDAEGNLWIATNTSLVKYHPDTRKTQHFDGRGGLQNSQFNLYAACRAKDGMMLFGGINGVSYFYPATIRRQPLQLHVSFTGLEVFNRLVVPGDDTRILARHIDQAQTLRFSHEFKQFSVLFNTFNYISANRIRYLYRLEGFEEEWQQTDGVPRATYTNLPPGKYVFHVKAVGPEGEASPERTLQVVVTPVWYKSNWFYLLLAAGAAITAFLLYRVLTERMRALHQLKLERLQREKADYINQVKTDFFTNVSHELRTPLTLIMAPLEEMMQQPPADKRMRQLHQLMLANARRLYQLVNQLFEFRKTESGTRRLRVGRGDLVKFVQEVYLTFKPLADKNNIRYTFVTSLASLDLYFDRDALENILFNLLSNAFKYTAAGESVELVLASSGNDAVIQVKDTGKGIAPEHLGRIFDRFYQVEGQEMNLGSGVGLAFTKRLVELHHGSIHVESTPGAGSVFTVKIPSADETYAADQRVDAVLPGSPAAAVPEDAAAEEAQAGPLTGAAAARESLLIVDDNREIVNYLETYFSREYDVCTAHDGKEALAALETQQPDLIISDVMMPEMDGLHFCKRVKQNVHTSHIPLILVTAKSETTQQVKGLEMGADDYITKPFSIVLLEAKVRSTLRMRRRLREMYAAGQEMEPAKMTFNDIDESFLKKAITIVEDNMQEYDFSVDKLSRELGMSRSNLYLKLKSITGESVTAFIKHIRLKKAASLIEARQHTIAEIAYMCGFNTPSYFSTVFKQFYGCMPSEYLASKQSAAGKNPGE